MAAPKPATPKANMGGTPTTMPMQAMALMPLAHIMTRRFGQVSAQAPTQGPSTT